MAVVLVAEGQRSNDKPIPETNQRYLVAELVLLVLLTLADAKNIGLMKRVYLVAVNLFAVDEFQAQVKTFPVGADDRQLTEQFPDQLSGGQKQRVGIARALVTNPSILLSDEATSALDPDTMESILDLLKRINKEMGITIVMVTHQIRAVQKICNKVAVMQSGKVIEEGEVFQVFSNPQQEITRDFVRTVVPDVITPSVCRQIRMESKGNYEILRLKFTGNNALGDLIYQINTKFLLKTRILHATVTELDEQTLGILILQISGSPEQIAEVEEYVRDCGVQCEEVKCQYGF